LSEPNTPNWSVATDVRTSTYWSERPYVSGALKAACADAEVLLAPYDGFRDHEGPLFAAGTAEIYAFLKERAPSTRVEAAIDDDKFTELSLHGDVIFLGTILLKYVVAPLFVTLLAEFIKRQLPLGLAKGEVRAHLLIEDGTGDSKRVVRVDYEGPAADFELSMPMALSTAQRELQASAGEKSGKAALPAGSSPTLAVPPEEASPNGRK
jgi:hypothetical protein